MRYLPVVLVALVLLFFIDVLWIGGIAMNFYRAEIGGLLAENVTWSAAFAFYIFYALALTVLVLKPALESSSLKKALILGAVFGFAAYMTYDLTNLATTRGWTLSVTIVDLMWGTFLTTLVSGLTYFISKKYLKL